MNIGTTSISKYLTPNTSCLNQKTSYIKIGWSIIFYVPNQSFYIFFIKETCNSFGMEEYVISTNGFNCIDLKKKHAKNQQNLDSDSQTPIQYKQDPGG